MRELMEATPDAMHIVRLREGADAATLTPSQREAITKPDIVVRYKGIHGQGLIRIVDEDSGELLKGLNEALLGFSPNATFLTSRGWTDPPSVRERRKSLAVLARFDRGTAPVVNDPTRYLVGIDEGLNLRIPEPMVQRAQGVLVHFQSLAGNPFEPQVLAEFRERGWAVFDVGTLSGIRAPLSDADQEKLDALDREAAELWDTLSREAPVAPGTDPEAKRAAHPASARIEQVYHESIRLRNRGFEACPGTDLEDLAREIALQVDQQLAGNAYAAEALVDYIRTQRADLHGLPIVVVGFSAGALATPAAVARIREDVDAVVLIGGAADLFLVSQDSTLTDGGLRLRCGEKKIDRKTRDRLHELYLRHTRLDPYQTAAALRGLPVLQVHASRDRWVPAKAGRLLTERLGKPDVMLCRGGHQVLFYLLPGQAKAIADWVERSTASLERPEP
jgi:predicted esterase